MGFIQDFFFAWPFCWLGSNRQTYRLCLLRIYCCLPAECYIGRHDAVEFARRMGVSHALKVADRLQELNKYLILPGTPVEEKNCSDRDTQDSIDTWAVGRGATPFSSGRNRRLH